MCTHYSLSHSNSDSASNFFLYEAGIVDLVMPLYFSKLNHNNFGLCSAVGQWGHKNIKKHYLFLPIGELIEQNQDGLEYSSEEETEDIKDAAANLASKQRKDLAKVDHASLDYMPYRKNFYTEVIFV